MADFTRFNLGQLTTINAAAVDTAADKFLLWDNSESGAARTKGMTAQQARLLVQGVDSQRGSTKPTQRSDGTSLQSGDRWWDTVENRWWFWNGTYWLSEQIFEIVETLSASLSAFYFPGGIPINPAGNDLFLLNFSGSIVQVGSTFDASNYWQFSARRYNSGNTAANDSTHTMDAVAPAARFNFSNTINVHRDVSALGTTTLATGWNRIGSPTNLRYDSSLRITYRFAKP